MHASDLTGPQQQALANLARRLPTRAKELLELETLGLVRRRTPSPTSVNDWELTPQGEQVAEEISR